MANKLGLDNTTGGDQGSIDDWVNEGVVDVLLRTRCRVQSATASLTVNTSDYTLDTNILATISLYTASGGTNYALEQTTPEDILRMRQLNSTTNSPTRWYAVAGFNLLMIYPTPSSADTLTFYYVPRPAALSASSDSPSDIPSEFHKLVELFALAEGADYDDDQSSAQGTRYRELYEKGIRELKKAMTKKGGSRPARAVANRLRRRLWVPTKPSQDVW